MAGARVLIVEDEFLIRLTLAEALSAAGFDVAEAADGEEAVRLLGENHAYDLLVTDIQLPGRFDGAAVARYARERVPDMAVVFATGRPDSLRALGTLGKRDALVQKPYGPKELLGVIRRVLDSGPGR